MKSFKFFLSTDVNIGVGAMKNVSDDINKLGLNRPAIIIDSNLNNNKYCKNNLDIILLDFPNSIIVETTNNAEPTYSDLESLNEIVKKNSPDSIIAIGGGSTMDLGKGISLLANNNVPALSLKGYPDNVNPPLPLFTVPSVFGSGSEISYNAVFIDEVENRKLGINTKTNFPIATFMDPLLTMSAPNKVIISSSMDTLVHCVDSFGSINSSPFSKMFSINGFSSTFEVLLNSDLSSPESRLGLAIGSLYGIIALMNSGDGPTNGFAYYFGVKDNIPHGLAGAVFLKEVMKWNYASGYYEYCQLLGKDQSSKDSKGNNKLFDDLDTLYSKLKLPNLTSYGYSKKDVPRLAIETIRALDGSFDGNPIPFDHSSAAEVLNNLV